jgi:hypothetical protein
VALVRKPCIEMKVCQTKSFAADFCKCGVEMNSEVLKLEALVNSSISDISPERTLRRLIRLVEQCLDRLLPKFRIETAEIRCVFFVDSRLEISPELDAKSDP